jgi:hypothetical protein
MGRRKRELLRMQEEREAKKRAKKTEKMPAVVQPIPQPKPKVSLAIPRYFILVHNDEFFGHHFWDVSGQLRAIRGFSTREAASTYKRNEELGDEWKIVFLGYQESLDYFRECEQENIDVLILDTEDSAPTISWVAELKELKLVLAAAAKTGDEVKANFSLKWL